MLAGSLDIVEEHEYYTHDFKKFYSDLEMTQELSDKDLNVWAVCLNSPWSQMHEKWTVECNCENAYKPMDENKPTFRCHYEIIGYDGLTAIIIGYGETPSEALQECIAHFEFLQSNYNKENGSF